MAEDQLEQNSSLEQSSYMAQDDVVTVVLTADNHLGYAAFGQHPRKREELQQRLRRAFQQATDFAVGQRVDLFVQVGDLFHTPVPDERDRSFVAACLAQLRQAGVRTFVVGGVHDTPAQTVGYRDEAALAPQMSYARLGALHYFAPSSTELEPVVVKVRNELVGICGLSVVAGQVGNPLTQVRVQSDIERATIPLLLLHAPIEGVSSGSSLLDSRAQVSRASIEQQSSFRSILAGYDHSYQQVRIGHCDVIVAGATQHFDFRSPEQKPGFVFLGLAADGIRWCTHIPVETLTMQRLLISMQDLWLNEMATEQTNPTEAILAQLSPLCSAPIRPDYACPPDRTADAANLEMLLDIHSGNAALASCLHRPPDAAADGQPECKEVPDTAATNLEMRPDNAALASSFAQSGRKEVSTFGQAGRAENEQTMVQLRLVGKLTRSQYHQLDLNCIRRYGEQHCFALAIDDSDLEIVAGISADISESKAQTQESSHQMERLSPREELMALVDEWIAKSHDEQEKQALCATKEDLLVAFDQITTSSNM